jgi:hypothetical protein
MRFAGVACALARELRTVIADSIPTDIVYSPLPTDAAHSNFVTYHTTADEDLDPVRYWLMETVRVIKPQISRRGSPLAGKPHRKGPDGGESRTGRWGESQEQGRPRDRLCGARSGGRLFGGFKPLQRPPWRSSASAPPSRVAALSSRSACSDGPRANRNGCRFNWRVVRRAKSTVYVGGALSRIAPKHTWRHRALWGQPPAP